DRVIHGFKDMRATLKSFVQDLIAMFAKKYFLQMVAGVTGNSTLGASAAQTGANTITGMVGNAAVSWLGNTAIGGSVAGAYGSFVAGYQGATLGAAAGGMGPTTVAAGGFEGAGA